MKLLIFNYLFSNGVAHLKNFSLSETPMGDYKLSPAYDLLNSRIHVIDNDFALDDGLLPAIQNQGKIGYQFKLLSKNADLSKDVFKDIFSLMVTNSDNVKRLVFSSFLKESVKRNYWQSYQGRLKQLLKK